MKLRNKKTGEIFEIELIYKSCNLRLPFKTCYGEDVTLSYLNENFEDAKEPLIKDEKIRKAVRAWAEAVEANKVVISYSRHDYLKITDTRADSDSNICFDYELGYTYNEDIYTITELCGEEEE
jgi:hypothetical protein